MIYIDTYGIILIRISACEPKKGIFSPETVLSSHYSAYYFYLFWICPLLKSWLENPFGDPHLSMHKLFTKNIEDVYTRTPSYGN